MLLLYFVFLARFLQRWVVTSAFGHARKSVSRFRVSIMSNIVIIFARLFYAIDSSFSLIASVTIVVAKFIIIKTVIAINTIIIMTVIIMVIEEIIVIITIIIIIVAISVIVVAVT